MNELKVILSFLKRPFRVVLGRTVMGSFGCS